MSRLVNEARVPRVGGFRVELTLRSTSWASALRFAKDYFSNPPSVQIEELIKFHIEFFHQSGSQHLECAAAVADALEKLACFVKHVPRKTYQDQLQLALQYAIQKKLFTSGQASDPISREKEVLLSEIQNVIGVYGWGVRKRYACETSGCNPKDVLFSVN